MSLRQHRGPKVEGNYREANQRMYHILPDLRFADTNKAPSSESYFKFLLSVKSVLPPHILPTLLVLSGIG